MATVGNNISGMYAHVRDSFFDSEEDIFYDRLLKSERGQKIYRKIKNKNVHELYDIACDYIQRVELGEFDEKGMKKAEAIIAICLREIEDVSKELVLVHEPLDWLEDNNNKKL